MLCYDSGSYIVEVDIMTQSFGLYELGHFHFFSIGISRRNQSEI